MDTDTRQRIAQAYHLVFTDIVAATLQEIRGGYKPPYTPSLCVEVIEDTILDDLRNQVYEDVAGTLRREGLPDEEAW